MWQREIRKLDRLRDSQCSCRKDNIFKVSVLLKSLLINFWPSFLSVSSRRINLVSIIPSWLEVKIVKVFWFWYKKIYSTESMYSRGTEQEEQNWGCDFYPTFPNWKLLPKSNDFVFLGFSVLTWAIVIYLFCSTL